MKTTTTDGDGSLACVKQHVGEVAAQSRRLASVGDDIRRGTAVSGWLAAQFLAAGRDKLAASEPSGHCAILGELARNWSVQHRAERGAARLQLENERLEARRIACTPPTDKEYRAWLKSPKMRKELHPKRRRFLSKEAIRKIREAADAV